MRRMWASFCGVLASLCAVAPAQAHKPSDSYLTLQVGAHETRGHWDIALRDLDRALLLDANGDGQLTWGELRARERELQQTSFQELTLSRGGVRCALDAGVLGLVNHSDGPYARLPFAARCPVEDGGLALSYGFFFGLDPQHRSVVRVEQGSALQTVVLTAEQRARTFDPAPEASRGTTQLIEQGVTHILSGLDHVLFLLALLLPALLRQRDDAQTPSRQIRRALPDVVRIVTAFTVAHSLTLGLAALGVVSMSAWVIEPAIAASVALAALDNVWPVFGNQRWSIAFVLGLLHGFGFSSALSDLGLHGSELLRGLFAFNLGVELGQLGLVALFVPLALLLLRGWRAPSLLMRGGSLAIAGLSLVWFVERLRMI